MDVERESGETRIWETHSNTGIGHYWVRPSMGVWNGPSLEWPFLTRGSGFGVRSGTLGAAGRMRAAAGGTRRPARELEWFVAGSGVWKKIRCARARLPLVCAMQQPALSMKWIVVAGAALALGFAAGHLVSRAGQSRQEAVIEAMRGEIGALQADASALEAARKEMAALKRDLLATQDALAASLANTPGDLAEEAGAEAAGQTADARKAFADMVMRVGHAQLKAQIEGRLGVLKDRLQLSDEQEARIKTILDQESELAASALERLMTRQGTPADFGRFARLQRGELPAGIASELTPAQHAEYAAFQEQERVTSVENRVNMELSGLIASGGLTPEQKDQAFSTLSGLVITEDATDFDSMRDAGEIRTYVGDATQRRLDVMEQILTEPQWRVYQNQVETGRQFLSNLLPPEPE